MRRSRLRIPILGQTKPKAIVQITLDEAERVNATTSSNNVITTFGLLLMGIVILASRMMQTAKKEENGKEGNGT